jgi:hypothetical protein
MKQNLNGIDTKVIELALGGILLDNAKSFKVKIDGHSYTAKCKVIEQVVTTVIFKDNVQIAISVYDSEQNKEVYRE